ncbi:tumor necrosis factor receptor superfamily member 5 [Callorhinchus milii]|nr:tumor necrosis factor receptor superfamily member 5 [Callorhinchus milii]|eukprot:gi/632939567/ref/XP_007910556.1/ PREDICTED: tumor necrosis factor receptor superfamily member 5-like [Callorhinchus milii]
MKFRQMLLLLIPTMQLYFCESSAKCNSLTQYYKVARCCTKCPPGSYMEKECTRKVETDCRGCEPHHYQSDWNMLDHCRRHTNCDPNGGFETDSEGDTTHNTVCRCAVGKHCANKDCEVCMDDTPNEELVAPDDHWPKDTECKPCQPGFYSDVSCAVAPCKPWTDCGPKGQLKPGNTTSDVICNPDTVLSAGITAAIVVGVLLVVLVALIGGGFYMTDSLKKWPGSLLGKTKQVAQPHAKENNNDVRVVLLDSNGCARDPNVEETSIPVPETQMPGQVRCILVTASQEDGKESHLPEQEQASYPRS